MKRYMFPLLFCLLSLQMAAQQSAINKQRHFRKTVPAGNYSGIAWLGDDRYAVVDDKSQTAGFRPMTIRIDDKTGDIKEILADSLLTSGQPNRDEEGICYVPQSNTVFVSGEADGQIIEYDLNGQLTGRRLNIPSIFNNPYSNRSFEALTYNANTHRFWTTTECTLPIDGVKPDITNKVPSLVRLQSFGDDLQPCEQYWYHSDSTDVTSSEGKSVPGIVGLAALDDGQIIVLERDIYITPKYIGSHVHVKLYVVRPSMQKPGDLLQKQLVAEFRTKINLTDRSFANYEGICVGPQLSDGRLLLMLVSDSQNQYKGYVRDWFRTVVVSDLDFRPLPNTAVERAALLKALNVTGEEKKVKVTGFLSNQELPDPTRFLAEPPQPGTGPFENDTYYYHYGKEQRETARGAQAALDEVQWTSKAFSPAFGLLIDPDETPEIFKLAERARRDARAVNRTAKKHFHRTRPYVYFNEPSISPESDEDYKDSYSYPSGHAVRGWVYALTLALVAPDSTESLIVRAQEFAINRVICGRHYKSDIDASLVEATAVMSRLLSNAAFQEQLEKARREYARLRK